MTASRVNALDSVEIGVADLSRAAAFYRDVWGLPVVHQSDVSCHLRATGPRHHALVLHKRPKPGLVRVNFGAADRATVEALHRQVSAKGGAPLGAPAALDEPGGGYGFAFRDLEGRELRVIAEVARHPDAADDFDRPRKLSHVVFNSSDVPRTSAFLCDALGLRVSDQTAFMHFLRCDADHHAIAVSKEGPVSINHVSWEMPSFDALMYGVGRLREQGYGIEWGVGRHGPGSNIFAYFVDPDGYAAEYTAEVEQIDECTHKPGTPESWQQTPIKRPDRWGLALFPSERVRAAMRGDNQA